MRENKFEVSVQGRTGATFCPGNIYFDRPSFGHYKIYKYKNDSLFK